MKVLGLIPARGGSKGIPKKNIRNIAGKPLISWTIETALASNVSSVVVSTDDLEIADLAKEHGADVPFIRPRELSLDDTPGISVAKHAIDLLPGYDALILLQPTSPLRSSEDINNCLRKKEIHQAPSVVSVVECRNHPHWAYSMTESERLLPFEAKAAVRRQNLPPAFSLNGAIYLAGYDQLRNSQSFIDKNTVAYLMPNERSVDIDDYFDWRIAEMLLKERQ
jgi:N-acylneuraminate cytidylyltransferase/CMP-N,N'-diacetyllegionaminic acid synthase